MPREASLRTPVLLYIEDTTLAATDRLLESSPLPSRTALLNRLIQLGLLHEQARLEPRKALQAQTIQD